MSDSTLSISDHLAIKRILAQRADIPDAMKAKAQAVEGRSRLGLLVLHALPHILTGSSDPDLASELLDRLRNTLVVESRLSLKKLHADGRIEDRGIVATKSDLITTAGVNFLVGILDGVNVTATTEKYHAIGTSATAAAIGDVALGAEIAGATYSTGSRAVGTTVAGSSANIYHTVATNTIAGGAAAQAIVELGLMTAATAGTLIDHFVFAVLNLNPNDSVASTLDLTYSAGG